MKLPERQEFLDYCEGIALDDSLAEKHILQILASSSLIREQMAEVKRELYFVQTQVPDYQASEAFAAQVSKLAQSWSQLSYQRKFGLDQFYRSKEFLYLMLFVASALIFAISLLGLKLIG